MTLKERVFLMRPIAFAPGSKTKGYGSTDPLRIASRSIGQGNLSEAARITKAEQSMKDFGVELNTGIRAVDMTSRPRNFRTREIVYLKTLNPLTIVNSERKSEEMFAPKDSTLFTKIEGEGFRLTILIKSCVAGSGRILYPNAFLDDSRRAALGFKSRVCAVWFGR